MTDKRDSLLHAAAGAQRSGQFEAAQRFAGEALELDPTCVPAMFLVGVASARQGNAHQAETMLLRVLRADPNAFEAMISLSTIYRDIDRLDDSIEWGRRAVFSRPNDAQAHNNLGRSLLAARRLEAATSAFAKATSLQPTFAAAYYNLGKTKQLEGRDGDAARCFGQAASLSPSLENHLALGQMLLTLCDFENALECAQRCIALYPQSPAAHLLLCGALTETNAIVAAEDHLNAAIALDPEGFEAMHTATRQRPLGYIDEANENLRRAIAQNPRLVSAYDSLMQNHRVTEEDRQLIDNMDRLLSDGQLSQTELVSIHYGLGKAREDLGEYAVAMKHYDEANRMTRQIKFGNVPFDDAAYHRRVERMIAPFEVGKTVSHSDLTSEVPILIVGMMRSGTSLVEQILSSHPDVVGAGELLFWTRNWSRAFKESSNELDGNAIEKLGLEYLRELERFGPSSKRVIDKMPGNVMFAGIVHSALPNARFIHVRRHPVDTCLSIWATPNHQPHEGGNNKTNIVFTYKQYLLLVERWRSFLPSDRLLEIDYEELVAQPELNIRKMLSFCGLSWNGACLRPHENKRLVATPSAWQVRQPFYGNSVAKWKRFEPWLGEFRELLDPN